MKTHLHLSRCVRSAGRRGAALYITVMSVALIVSLLSLAGLTVVRLERRQAETSTDLLLARSNARSAVELALSVINSNPLWRLTHLNGVETTPQTLGPNGTGTVSWILEDSDGSLVIPDTSLRLKGIGRVGDTVQVLSVEIDGAPAVLDTLECSVYAVGAVTQSSNSTSNDGPFVSGTTMTVNGTVWGDAEGDPVIIAGTVTGTVSDPGPNRTMPSAGVWDVYKALATTIPYTSFTGDPADPDTRSMTNTMLSGSYNPFGLILNPLGIYYVQVPSGKKLEVTKSRLHCTLLIELMGTGRFNTAQSCLWDPYNGGNYPCAIVKGLGAGTFELKSSNAQLKEAQQPKFNYNPPGNPYDGDSNLTTNDNYYPKMRGLFHVIGSGVHATLASNLNLTGVFISEGTMTLGANLTVNRDPNIMSNPPLGYTAGTGDIEAVMGSWQWDAAP